jgi:hypothetical protein
MQAFQSVGCREHLITSSLEYGGAGSSYRGLVVDKKDAKAKSRHLVPQK